MFDGSGKIPQYYFSAFGLAVQQGFQGSLDDWLKSLIGPPGDPGKNAYQYAQEYGYTGTEEDFAIKMASNGKSAYEYARENGYKGTEEEFGLKMAALDIRLLNGKEADKFGILNLVPADLGAIDEKGGAMEGQLTVQEPASPAAAVPKSYADQKLAKAGGKMTGPIDMGSQAITGLKAPVQPTDAATLKAAQDAANAAAAAAVNNAVKLHKLTLTVEDWTEAQEQVISVPGVTADAAKCLIQYSYDPSTREAYLDSDVYMSAQGDGNVTFKWVEAKPEVPLLVNVAVRVIT